MASEFYNEQQADFETVEGEVHGDTLGGFVRADYIHYSFKRTAYIPSERMHCSNNYLVEKVYKQTVDQI